MKWKTKDGELLEIGQMTTSHIFNAKKMLQEQVNEVDTALACCDEYKTGSEIYQSGVRFSEKAHLWIKRFSKELSLRNQHK